MTCGVVLTQHGSAGAGVRAAVAPERGDAVSGGKVVGEVAAGASVDVTPAEKKPEVFKSGDEIRGWRRAMSESEELRGGVAK